MRATCRVEAGIEFQPVPFLRADDHADLAVQVLDLAVLLVLANAGHDVVFHAHVLPRNGLIGLLDQF